MAGGSRRAYESGQVRGTPDELLAGVDVLIGVSGPGAVSPHAVRAMARDAVVFALAIAYFALYSRHHIVSGAPEEVFAAIESAEKDLH